MMMINHFNVACGFVCKQYGRMRGLEEGSEEG